MVVVCQALMAGGTTVQPIVSNGCGLMPKGVAVLPPVSLFNDMFGSQPDHYQFGPQYIQLLLLRFVGWVVVPFLEWILGLRCFLA
ncbi:hypothetical protein A2U01_0007080 [Trifolium medium]|uniref:Uncharacterized protein n=1 Tax=Trifolium medium TaxID=97028 RepID=A0A392MFE8_9FABA|nr:hypothetical protein [Trifolium medium]